MRRQAATAPLTSYQNKLVPCSVSRDSEVFRLQPRRLAPTTRRTSLHRECRPDHRICCFRITISRIGRWGRRRHSRQNSWESRRNLKSVLLNQKLTVKARVPWLTTSARKATRSLTKVYSKTPNTFPSSKLDHRHRLAANLTRQTSTSSTSQTFWTNLPSRCLKCHNYPNSSCPKATRSKWSAWGKQPKIRMINRTSCRSRCEESSTTGWGWPKSDRRSSLRAKRKVCYSMWMLISRQLRLEELEYMRATTWKTQRGTFARHSLWIKPCTAPCCATWRSACSDTTRSSRVTSILIKVKALVIRGHRAIGNLKTSFLLRHMTLAFKMNHICRVGVSWGTRLAMETSRIRISILGCHLNQLLTSLIKTTLCWLRRSWMRWENTATTMRTTGMVNAALMPSASSLDSVGQRSSKTSNSQCLGQMANLRSTCYESEWAFNGWGY